MGSPRWNKVLRDLWGNKVRTLLVALSIAIGVFAVGGRSPVAGRTFHYGQQVGDLPLHRR